MNYTNLNKLNLHSPSISKESAIIAKRPKVREVLKSFQITFSKKNKRCCIEGRDIATKILPKSDLKFFFKCNLNIAAFRRYKELKKKDKKIKLKNVKKALRIRNNHDLNRRITLNIEMRRNRHWKIKQQAMLKKMNYINDN